LHINCKSYCSSSRSRSSFNIRTTTSKVSTTKEFYRHFNWKKFDTPVDTKATGQARFHMNANGTLCYYVDVRNITGVVGAHVGLKNGTELASLTNPYAEVATIASYPTAAVDGILIAGEIKAGTGVPVAPPLSAFSLSGPLVGKNVTALDDILNNKTASVTVRTTAHEQGEIQGQIVPTNSHVGCLSTMRFAYPPPTTPSPSNFGP
jgi:CHRD domain